MELPELLHTLGSKQVYPHYPNWWNKGTHTPFDEAGVTLLPIYWIKGTP